MTDDRAHALPPEDQPGTTSVEEGIVILDGPDGVAVAMTPAAARETGRRLLAAADEADGRADD